MQTHVLSLITIIIFLFLSCEQQKHEQEKDIAEEESTTIMYASIDKDTNASWIPLSMYNEPYDLRIKKFSLNDSALFKEVLVEKEDETGMEEAVFVAHNYVGEIILTKEEKKVLHQTISKEIFQDSLDSEFYQQATIFDVAFKAVRSNRLYFKAVIAVPDTDWAVETEFAIFYQTEKKGQLDYWGVRE